MVGGARYTSCGCEEGLPVVLKAGLQGVLLQGGGAGCKAQCQAVGELPLVKSRLAEGCVTHQGRAGADAEGSFWRSWQKCDWR